MDSQNFLRNAVNKIVLRNPSKLKAEIQELSTYNPTIALENKAYQQLKTNPALQLNQQIIKESLLPSQAEQAANAYLQNIVNNAVQNATINNIPIETAVKNTLKNVSPKNYLGNAPQGTGALTQVVQEINNPLFQTLIDPESPLGMSEVEALKYLY